VSNFNSGTLALYSSIKTDDKVGQLALLSAISDAEPLNEHVGETIQLKDFVLQATTVVDEQTKEERDAVRIILIDADGTALACVSDGMVKALQNMVAIMGQPGTWDEPLAIKVVEKRSRRGFRFMTISYEV
jgi:hypothetical protein